MKRYKLEIKKPNDLILTFEKGHFGDFTKILKTTLNALGYKYEKTEKIEDNTFVFFKNLSGK